MSRYGGYEQARNVALEFLDDIDDMKNETTTSNCKLPSHARKLRRSTVTWQQHGRRKKRQRSVAVTTTDAKSATPEEGMNSECLDFEMKQILNEVGEKRMQFESACQTLLDDVKRMQDISEQLQKDIEYSRTMEQHEGLVISQNGSTKTVSDASPKQGEYDRNGSGKSRDDCNIENPIVFSRGSIYAINNSPNEDQRYW
eukprot:CAMPEP_0185268610 /NCGR_PEP_ID=MMETSP1359-20130426/37473_1 /TAXON_ID=552665 /ORGANISM="Bigelowiella longifila, Strain CCMP242" /LENGTH=198 /DNA_ID=CAMNT_0027859421 /DNA_START=197 /DNA_END=790 /DNA_ORIENTATION=-